MRDFEEGKTYFGFKLTQKKAVEDIDSCCHVFEHEKTGAKLFYAQNEDNNKVFFVSFKTPPQDDCGTAHILEHSVLCGSKKYSAKDPFNTLVKGSLSTYLNALTYSDKTMYPVGSCNQEDFTNLMDVYMDAVFNPVAITEKKIFQQEGWHYELNDPADPITINGVVYNEMKGAFSGPDRALNEAINRSLFSESVYRHESGGDPEAIPTLTYEEFVAFYNKYYHPTNSFFYLYGDLDIDQALNHINEEYLINYEKQNVAIVVEDEPEHTHCGFVSDTFSVPKGTKTGKESMLSFNFVVGKSTDTLLALSMEVLSYILLETGASPIKKAIIDKEVADSVEGWFDSSTKQMVFSIIAKNTTCKKIGNFKETVLSTLKSLLKDGIDKDLINSAINHYEFLLREADYGYRPKGLAYGMDMMKGWLHGQNPIEALKVWEHFETMRQGAKGDYFENLIKVNILKSPIHSMAAVAAEEGKQERAEDLIAIGLDKFKKSLSAKEIEELIKQTKELTLYQSEADSQEVLDKIPMLKKEDIGKEASFDRLIEEEISGVKSIFVPLDTNGIVYTKMMFSTDKVPTEMVSFAGLLARVLGRIDTVMLNYEALPTEINMYTGGIRGSLAVYKDKEKMKPMLSIKGRALVRNADKLFEIMQEIVFGSLYSSIDNLKKIILELKADYERHFDNDGHAVAVGKSKALLSEFGQYEELTSGIAFNDFLEYASNNLQETAQGLKKVADIVFTRDNLTITSSAEEKNMGLVSRKAEAFIQSFPMGKAEKQKFEFDNKILSEAVETGSKIVYNAVCGNFVDAGFSYSGKLSVIKNIINTQFLWNEVRVKGGAYGSGINFERNGLVYAYSYRDPNVKQTYDNFEAISAFLDGVVITPKDMVRYTLGAINAIDKPKSSSDRLEIAIARYFNGYSKLDVQKERDEILSVTQEDVKSVSLLFAKAMEHKAICTFGSETKIGENKPMFQKIRKLYIR